MDNQNSNKKSPFGRDDRGGRSFFRARRDGDARSDDNNRSEERSERPHSSYSAEHKPYASKERSDKPYHSNKPYGDRDSKPRFGGGDRDSKPRYGSDNRGGDREFKPRFGGGDRDSKPRYGSDNRGGDRDSKPRYGSDNRGGDREFKPRFGGGDRDSKPSYGSDNRGGDREFKPRFGGGDRDSKPSYGHKSYGDRDSKPRYGSDNRGGDREFKPRFGDRDSKPSYGSDNRGGDREFKPRFGDRDSKPSYGDRDSKPRYGSDNRGGDRDSKPRYGSDNRGGDREFKPRFGGGDRDSKPRYGSDNRGGDREFKPRFGGGDREFKPRYDKKDGDRPSFVKRDRKPRFEESAPVMPDEMRLNRYIAMSGVCSRREADQLIGTGEVTVNGVMVDQLGSKVHPASDEVRLNGELLKGEKKVYIVLNKPKGYVTTVEDPHADQTVIDLLKGECKERIYPVGRLDKNTTGVLLLTNDGNLTKELTHPSFAKKKIYHVFLDKPCTEADLEKMVNGIELEDGPIHADEMSFVDGKGEEVGVELHSGRNRIVRRMFESLGYEVVKLDRVYFAGLTKMGLRRGFWRHLTPREVSALKSGSYE